MPEDMNVLTLEEAKNALRRGIKFGEVYPYLNEPANGDLLKAFFAYGKHLEHDASAEARAKGYTGDTCTTCSSMCMVRVGTCLRCDSCGSTSGGCG